MNGNFGIKDCALIAIATGEQAQNLREFRDRLAATHLGCVYYHFWAGLLRHRFDDPEFQNDFAVWASRALHDPPLAERLSLIDPNRYRDLEELRREVIEIIEERLYEKEYIPWARQGDNFHFVRSQIVVFDSGIRAADPAALKDIIPSLPLGSVFYHFIDARRRTEERKNDFSVWLGALGGRYADLAGKLDSIDPYFTTLRKLREEISEVFREQITGAAS